jgi:Rod binding domain-containing protein
MAGASVLPSALMTTGQSAAALASLASASKSVAKGADKARAAAQEFEAVFLSTMFQQMFTGIDGEGPFGGSGSAGVWRSFLTEQYGKSFARAGGIGLADDVYRTLIAQQEARR